jgi:hypothetical protein
MHIFKRKSRRQRLLATAADHLPAPIGRKRALPGRPSDKTVKVGLITAGGLTGLTAGSAGISTLRRRIEGAGDDS